MLVFFTSGNRTRKAVIEEEELTFDTLGKTYRRVFPESTSGEGGNESGSGLTRSCFMLRHRLYRVEYEGFDISEIYDGALIRVREPGRDWEGMKYSPIIPVDRNLKKQLSRRKSLVHLPNGKIDMIRDVVFRTLDDPSSGKLAVGILLFMLTLILFSTITFMVETLPRFYEHEKPKDSVWFIMEASAISIFTIEFVLRLSCCPNLTRFIKGPMNIIDFVAILPFYIDLMLQNADIPGLSILRVLRLVRVFRLFKVSRGSISVFARTMRRSAQPLYMLFFFTGLATVIFSSLMYYLERGSFNEDLNMWMRLKYYECEIVAYTTWQQPAMSPYFLLPSGRPEYNNGFCKYMEPQPVGLLSNSAVFLCPYNWKKNDTCSKVYEQSPFVSIPKTCWWALTTMTTVGYGDMYPTQWHGQLLGCALMLLGVIIIALPITVIGSNFAKEYRQSMEGSDEDEDEVKEGEGVEPVQVAM